MTQPTTRVILATISVARGPEFARRMGNGVEAHQSVEETVSVKSLNAVNFLVHKYSTD